MRNVAISFEFRLDYFFEINLVILNKMQLIRKRLQLIAKFI